MVFVKKGESSVQQMAYAKRILGGGKGTTKQTIALDCGYSPNIARSAKSHIENTAGFNNAMVKLAVQSNNLALAAMHEFQSRGFHDFTNKELIGSLNAIGNAWSKFNAPARDANPKSKAGNKLRTVILQQVENQTIIPGEEKPEIKEAPREPIEMEVEVVDSAQKIDLDF